MYSLFDSRAVRLAIGRPPTHRWLALAALPLVLGAMALAEQEENSMTILLNTPEARDYQSLELTVRPLAAMDTPGPEPSPPAAAPDYRARFANSERNGRVDVALPEGEWVLAWAHEVRKGMLPQAVLSSGDRVLVHTGVWQLFDLDGNLLKEGSGGPSTVALDPEHVRFYHMNRTGDIVGRNLTDGAQVFAAMPFLSSEFSRPLIRCYGQRLLLIGIERQLDPHGHQKASRSLIEWINLGEPLEVSGTGLLVSARNEGTLIFPTTAFAAAASADLVACASPGHLYIAGLSAQLDAVYGAEFEPVNLSLGGNGVIYLAVRAGDDQQLWCVSPAGERLQSFTLPVGTGTLVAPPIVGRDNRIYLAGMNRVVALGPQAELLWEWKAPFMVIGATCTADGTLVVVTEREAGLLSPEGEFLSIHRIPESRFYTAPCITRDGAIVVATEREVLAFHCR